MYRNIGVVVMRYLNILFAFAFEATLLHEAVDGIAVCTIPYLRTRLTYLRTHPPTYLPTYLPTYIKAIGAFIIVGGCVVSVLCSPGSTAH